MPMSSVAILAKILPTIPGDAHSVLISPITSEEITTIMFSINGDKATGPDGYSSQFFKTS